MLDAERLLTQLSQIEGADGHLAEFILLDPNLYLPIAIEVAVQSGGAIGRVLAKILHERPDIPLAVKIERNLPLQTLALRELAAEVSCQLSDCYQSFAGEATSDHPLNASVQAKTHNNLAVRLDDLGKTLQAVQHAESAARIFEQLADKRPWDFLQDWTASLSILAALCSKTSRHKEAIAHARRAVTIYEALRRRTANTLRLEFILALKNLSSCYARAGQSEEALRVAWQATKLSKNLNRSHEADFLPVRAAVLNNLACRLAEWHHPRRGLFVAKRVAALYEQLLSQREDAYLPDRAASLSNLSDRLKDTGNVGLALEKTEEAILIYHKLASKWPVVFLPELASCQTKSAVLLLELARLAELEKKVWVLHSTLTRILQFRLPIKLGETIAPLLELAAGWETNSANAGISKLAQGFRSLEALADSENAMARSGD